jgi:hypothetical protein
MFENKKKQKYTSRGALLCIITMGLGVATFRK